MRCAMCAARLSCGPKGDVNVIRALKTNLTVAEERERDIDPENDPIGICQLIALTDGTIVCVYGKCEKDASTCVYLLSEDGTQTPVPGLGDLEQAWSVGERMLVQVERTIKLVDREGTAQDVVTVPEDTSTVDVAWCDDGIRLAAIVKGDRHDGPELYPPPPYTDSLQTYAPSTGWRTVCEIPEGASHISLSADGSRCAWRTFLNIVPEEAMRGEFKACDLSTGEITDLTEGAGKAWFIRMAPDGSGAVYQANFEQDRPITTHTDVWWHPWGETEPTRLTRHGRNVEDFGWIDESTLWITYIEGVDRETEAVKLDGSTEAKLGGADHEVVRGTSGPAYVAVGDCDRFPYLRVGKTDIDLSAYQTFSDLKTRVVQWAATDGLSIRGVIYEANGLRDGAPLIVKAHGGPAGDVEAVRSGAIRLRYLIRAGYRVFEPAFRGSLGFGDDFLRANIGCQGEKDLDDIVTGVDRLVEMGVADPDRVGITGGSYGGYMTIRAVAVTDRFETGVALYGFIDNRWMTLDTGDFTYENEYIAPVAWPMDMVAPRADVFSILHEIDCPLLLMHGDQDPICPLSQSKVVHRALEHRGVTSGLVVYAGEGHGFRNKENRVDCARRTLAWFEEFLPA
ncbi:TPA: hypothetical protein DCE37_18420 [Candidatus Latescibacteria bacterium]|nr:hypothetical protein [Candidatus Latescibacterota bacterium]